MRLQLDGITPSPKASLLAALDTSSIDQFTMSTGSVSVGVEGIEVNLTRGVNSASAQGFFNTGIAEPVSISRVEVDMAITYSIARFAEAKVGDLGMQYVAGAVGGPPKAGRVYSFSNTGLGQDILGYGVSHMAPGSVGQIPIRFSHQDAPPDGPLFRAAGFAVITRIEIWGDWWWD